MEAMNYVKPELIVVAFVLYFFGVALRQAQAVKNKYIPLILGGISMVLCARRRRRGRWRFLRRSRRGFWWRG